MDAEDRKLWGGVVVKGWQVYLENEAVQVLSLQNSADIRHILPTFALTDKADGLRTGENQLEEYLPLSLGSSWFS